VTLYAIVLFVHSTLRWAVLGLAATVVVRTATGVGRARDWTRVDERLTSAFVGVMDLQLLLGLVLYLYASPLPRALLADLEHGMKEPVLRFFGIEHIFGMLVAVTIVHVGRVRSKRAPTARLRHRRMLVATAVGLLIFLGSIPWPFLRYGRPLLRT